MLVGMEPCGCTGSVPSKVMSVPLTPASVERITPRLLATCSPYKQAADVDDVGMALRRLDEHVVPALRRAQVERRPTRRRRARSGQVCEDRRARGDVVAPEQP